MDAQFVVVVRWKGGEEASSPMSYADARKLARELAEKNKAAVAVRRVAA